MSYKSKMKNMIGAPKTIDEYKEWLTKNHKVEITNRTQSHYDSVTTKVKQDFERSDFWARTIENLGKYEGEYLLDTGYPLFIAKFEPKLHIKSFESFLLKTFRKNILENENYPKAPIDGWILPDNWFSRINDIVRTLLVVKYLDGVDFMVKKVNSLCDQQGMKFMCFMEAREEGYYAAHLYTRQKFEIPKITWDTEMTEISIELQITTQLQEVIRRLLHKYYDERRKTTQKSDSKWQWDYESNEFIANYLGHILHYVEGMIVDIREKQKEERT